MKTSKLFLGLLFICSTVIAQQKIKLKGLVINPDTFEKKEFPKVLFTIKGLTKTSEVNKKGKFKIKGKGTTLVMSSEEYTNLEEEVPKSARQVLVLVNEYRALMKFLTRKETFENIYPSAKKEFDELPIIIEQPPVFPGCEGVESANQKHCFYKKINRHIAKHFNTDLANELGLPSGRNRIFVKYTIDKNGDIVDVEIRAPHPKLKKEVIRVIKKLPKIQPAIHKGKTVRVKYHLPITFAVE